LGKSVELKALVIDDEPSIRRLLKTALAPHGVEVEEAPSGREGLVRAIALRPDVIFLDLGLPDLPGMQVLRSLREWFVQPILILSVRDREEGIVEALDLGADDYLTKPFKIGELLARMRVAQRHRNPIQESVKLAGDVTVDIKTRRVCLRGQEVKLTATEFDVLKALVRNAGRVLTHRQMLREIWGPNASEHVQYLRVYVGHLRQKLEAEPNAPVLIVTEPGVGYRLVLA
jgi:two-component system, OmpR family, KDP operon response regulator KdpE